MPKKLMPEGLYMAAITTVFVGENRKKNITVNVDVALIEKVDGRDPTKSEAVPSIARRIYMVINANTAEFQAKNMEACGYNPEDHGDIQNLDPRYSKGGGCPLAGNTIPVYCEHEKNEKGEINERWQVSRGVAPPEIANDAKLERANALLSKHFGGRSTSNSSVPTRQPAPAETPTEEPKSDDEPTADDLPWT